MIMWEVSWVSLFDTFSIMKDNAFGVTTSNPLPATWSTKFSAWASKICKAPIMFSAESTATRGVFGVPNFFDSLFCEIRGLLLVEALELRTVPSPMSLDLSSETVSFKARWVDPPLFMMQRTGPDNKSTA